jgi:hypothetical protein
VFHGRSPPAGLIMVYGPRISRCFGLILRVGGAEPLETHSVERKLAAIFAADVEGYSRLMGQDEVGTLRTLTAYRAIVDRLIASHRGRIFNTAGDSVLADFASAVDAVQCAIAVQDAIRKENADRPAGDTQPIKAFRITGEISPTDAPVSRSATHSPGRSPTRNMPVFTPPPSRAGRPTRFTTCR